MKKKENKNEDEEEDIAPRVKVLHEEYKSDLMLQQMFIPISMLRVTCFGAILALLPGYPLAQSIMTECMHVAFLVHLIVFRPVKEKSDLYVQIYFELCNVGVAACVIGIAAVSGSSNFELQQDVWNNLGSAIVVFNYLIVGAGLILTVISGVGTAILIFKLIKAWLERRRQRKRAESSTIITISFTY